MKEFVKRNIGYIALVFGGIGMLSQVLRFFNLSYKIVPPYLESVYLSIFNSQIFILRNPIGSGYLNALNLFFYFLLIVGSIIYFRTNNSEKRLLKFGFSIIFFVGVFGILFTPVNLAFYLSASARHGSEISYITWGLSFITSLLYIVVSFHAIKHLTSVLKFQIIIVEKGEEVIENFVEATKLKRFFHVVLDMLICLMIIQFLNFIFNSNFVRKLPNNPLVMQFGLSILFLLYRLIYYPFFEGLFGATPAKFLTGTRVATIDGQKPDFITIILRTLSRFVPFEPFSFFLPIGWHDEWTKTRVYEIEKPNINGAKYFFLLLAFILFLVGSFIGLKSFKKISKANEAKAQFQERKEGFKNQLDYLTADDVFQLKSATYNYQNKENTYLKIEQTSEKEVVCAVLKIDRKEKTKLRNVQKFIDIHAIASPQITIKKKDLIDSYTGPAGKFGSKKKLLPDEQSEYLVEFLDSYNNTIVRNTGSGSFSGRNGKGASSFTGTMKVYNKSATLIKIENLEGEIKWLNTMPQSIQLRANSHDGAQFQIRATNYTQGKKYKTVFTFEDEDRQKIKYLLTGKNNFRHLVRYFE